MLWSWARSYRSGAGNIADPQTVERFKARFSTGRHATSVAVLHSHLSDGERHDEWHKIREGRARIVIGARSAICPGGTTGIDHRRRRT